MQVKELMKKEYLSVAMLDTLSHAFALILNRGLAEVPVINRNKQLEGLIDKYELARVVGTNKKKQNSDYQGWWANMKGVRIVEYIDKNRELPLIHESADIKEAALKMISDDISSLPVLNEQNQVVGMIYKNDVLRYFVEQ